MTLPWIIDLFTLNPIFSLKAARIGSSNLCTSKTGFKMNDHNIYVTTWTFAAPEDEVNRPQWSPVISAVACGDIPQ